MDPLGLIITNAGLAAFTRAQLGDDIDLTIARVGFTNQPFLMAPTLTALPGEFKRLDTVAGQTTGPDTIHMIVRDASAETYSVRGFGLFLSDGTLFAAYVQTAVLLEKATSSIAMLALDLRFPPEQVAQITFGDANFLNPPATEAVQGVARIATKEKVAAGADDTDFVTSRKLKRLLPAGTVMMWWGAANAIPTGWAICDGSTVPRSDGAGTIVTPDLRGRTPVGVGGDHALGDAFGDTTKTAQSTDGGAHTPTGKLPAHDHAVDILSASSVAGITTTEGRKTDTAGGGSDNTLKNLTLTDPGHAHQLTGHTATTGDLALSMELVGDHHHKTTIDVTQPSLALFFIMRV